MADQALEILIKLLSDTKGAEAVQAALDKTRASAEDITTHLPEGAEAWQKYKGVLNQTAQESGNLKAAQEVLSSVVQKLKLPLHELTPLLKDFADPAKLGIDGLALAWEIWNKRVEEGTKAMAGMQLPDLSAPTAHLSEAQKALDAYNKSLNSVVESYNSIEAASNRAIKNLQNESQMRKELTKLHGAPESAIADIDQKERRDEIEEKKKLRSKLINDSSDNLKKAQDIHVATQEEDNKNLADAKAQAGEAKKAREEANKRLEDIQKLHGENAYAHQIDTFNYYMRYGHGTSIAEAQAIEQRTIDNADVIITKYQKMQAAQPEREALRARKQQLMTDAGKEQGEADVLGKQIPEEEKALRAKRLPELEKSLGITNQTSSAQSVEDYLGALGRLSAGKGSAADEQLRQHFAELLSSSKDLDHATYALLQKLIAHNVEMGGRISQLEIQHSQTASRSDRPAS